MGAARSLRNGSNPTYDSGALLPNWTMLIVSVNQHATLPHRGNATLSIINFFLPGYPVRSVENRRPPKRS